MVKGGGGGVEGGKWFLATRGVKKKKESKGLVTERWEG